jgi:hypothetical protein
MAIKYIKLVSGDELVSEVEEKENHFVLTRAALISTHFTFEATPEPPKTRIDIYCPHVSGLVFNIKKEHVLFCEDAHPGIETYYTDTFVAQLKKTIEDGTNV